MLATKEIERAVIWACKQEVSALKPGNVNYLSGIGAMQMQDFIKSADAIAPVLAQTGLSVGNMILQAIIATRQVVSFNTNLGIVLLFAPLCKAVQNCSVHTSLPTSLAITLNNLSVEDARQCYQAVRLAEPGGMGLKPKQDINSEPTVTLKQAMVLAKDDDTIAAQYCNNYQQIWQSVLPNLVSAIKNGENVAWASTFAYLKLLVNMPDSLICRKYGMRCAQKVMVKAKEITDKVCKNKRLSDFEADIVSWDNELKQKGVNPGTTADMVAAALLVCAFERSLS